MSTSLRASLRSCCYQDRVPLTRRPRLPAVQTPRAIYPVSRVTDPNGSIPNPSRSTFHRRSDVQSHKPPGPSRVLVALPRQPAPNPIGLVPQRSRSTARTAIVGKTALRLRFGIRAVPAIGRSPGRFRFVLLRATLEPPQVQASIQLSKEPVSAFLRNISAALTRTLALFRN